MALSSHCCKDRTSWWWTLWKQHFGFISILFNNPLRLTSVGATTKVTLSETIPNVHHTSPFNTSHYLHNILSPYHHTFGLAPQPLPLLRTVSARCYCGCWRQQQTKITGRLHHRILREVTVTTLRVKWTQDYTEGNPAVIRKSPLVNRSKSDHTTENVSVQAGL